MQRGPAYGVTCPPQKRKRGLSLVPVIGPSILKLVSWIGKRKELKYRRSQYPDPPEAKGLIGKKLLMGKNSKPRQDSPQLSSGLCRLPVELRMIIYDFVIDAQEIHVNLQHKKLRAVRCRDSISEADRWSSPCGPCGNGPVEQCGFGGLFLASCRLEQGIGAWSLMLTCRKIHTEIMDALLNKRTFVFHDSVPLLLFLSSIPPAGAQKISSLRIDAQAVPGVDEFELPIDFMPRKIRVRHRKAYRLPESAVEALPDMPFYRRRYRPKAHPSIWGAACDLLSGLHGLRELKIRLSADSFHCVGYRGSLGWSERGSERFVMEPLSCVKRSLGSTLRVFDLEVHWPVREEKEGWGMEVKRRPLD